MPDILFLIDLPEEIAHKRKDDVPSVDYLRDRRKMYLYIGNEYKMTILDGSMPLDELKYRVKEYTWGKINE